MPVVRTFPKVVDLAPVAHRLTAEAFQQRMGGPVLVGPPPSAGGDPGWAFRTDSRRVVLEPTSFLMVTEDDVVVALRKQRNVFADTILVGRAASNDVVLAHASISKLHARLRQGAAGEWVLSDAESSNGTTADGRRLGPADSVVLKDGTIVVFGQCQFQFMGAAKLHGMLRRFSA